MYSSKLTAVPLTVITVSSLVSLPQPAAQQQSITSASVSAINLFMSYLLLLKYKAIIV